MEDMKLLMETKERLLKDLQKTKEPPEMIDISQYYCTRESQMSVKSENRDQKRGGTQPETDQELEE